MCTFASQSKYLSFLFIITAIATREVSNSNPESNTSPADNQNDYTLVTTTLGFRDGQTEGEVVLEIHDDEIGETQEVFEVVIEAVTPDSKNSIIMPSVWRVYINDDDGGAPGGDRPGDDGDGGDAGGSYNGLFKFKFVPPPLEILILY